MATSKDHWGRLVEAQALLGEIASPSNEADDELADDTVKELTAIAQEDRDADLLELVARARLGGTAEERQCRALTELLSVAPRRVLADDDLTHEVTGVCDFFGFDGDGAEWLEFAALRALSLDEPVPVERGTPFFHAPSGPDADRVRRLCDLGGLSAHSCYGWPTVPCHRELDLGSRCFRPRTSPTRQWFSDEGRGGAWVNRRGRQPHCALGEEGADRP